MEDRWTCNTTAAAVDRHVDAGCGGRLALRWLGPEQDCRDYSYGDLHRESRRFAGVLRDAGIEPGRTVAVCTSRTPELYVAALGIWRYGCRFCPLFAAFGREPLFYRLKAAGAAALVTHRRLYESILAQIRPRLPDLRIVVLTDLKPGEPAEPGVRSFSGAMAAATPHDGPPLTAAEDAATLHFTSGTTGMPKGAIHVHQAVRDLYQTAAEVFDFRAGDVFWCTADPGWVTGTAYGLIAPLLHGVTTLIDSQEFDLGRWLRILEHERVSVWYTAPSAIRRLMGAMQRPRSFPSLRWIGSVGEPLPAAAVNWALRIFGRPIYDTWWQTETGSIRISTAAAPEVRAGAMGIPLSGATAGVFRRHGRSRIEAVRSAERPGELALRPPWASMFRGYLDAPDAYARCFVEGWYFTGDLVRRDSDGFYWFIGRRDDVINTAGHLVSPFEVESLLMEHPAVVESAVIGIPDAHIGQRVKAVVTLAAGRPADEALRRELLTFARSRLGPAIAPREIEFIDTLPRNRAGKILRRTLREAQSATR